MEQNDRALAASGNGLYGSKYQIDVKWTAPDSGFGQLSFWAVVNASNNDGHNGVAGGEYWNTKHIAYLEGKGPANDIASTSHPTSIISWNQSSVRMPLAAIESLEVYSLEGQKIAMHWNYKSTDFIQLTWLQQPQLGVYIIKATDNKGQVIAQKILVGIE
jgi:hypothetical protein